MINMPKSFAHREGTRRAGGDTCPAFLVGLWLTLKQPDGVRKHLLFCPEETESKRVC